MRFFAALRFVRADRAPDRPAEKMRVARSSVQPLLCLVLRVDCRTRPRRISIQLCPSSRQKLLACRPLKLHRHSKQRSLTIPPSRCWTATRFPSTCTTPGARAALSRGAKLAHPPTTRPASPQGSNPIFWSSVLFLIVLQSVTGAG